MLPTKPIKVNEFKLAIRSVGDEELIALDNEIRHSMDRLINSNSQMTSLKDEALSKIKKDEELYLEDDIHKDLTDDVKLYEESIKENEGVIYNHQERLQAIVDEKEYRGLIKKTPNLEISSSTKTKYNNTNDQTQSNSELDIHSEDQSNYVYL